MIGNEVPIEVAYSVPLKEITTRSKGDSFSKAVAFIQTTSFIVQCCARGAQHLPLTELELMTVGFAILSTITYFFWWFKPYKIDRPIITACPVDSAQPLDSSEATTSDFFAGFLRGIFGKPFLSSSKLHLFSPGTRQSSDPSFDDTALFFFLPSATIFGRIHLISLGFFLPKPH